MAIPIYRLGKRAKRRDPRTLRLAAYVRSTLPPAPATYDHTARVPRWGMMLNDTIGDCTCAGIGHLVEQWTGDCSGEVVVPDAAVLAAYRAISGYDPATGANDDGADLLTVLNYTRKTGVGGHTIGGYAEVAVSHVAQVKLAIYLFGAVYAGVQLPLSAQGQTEWVVPAGGKRGRGRAGSWGGHCVVLVAYDDSTVTCVTWGQTLKMSWGFFVAYFDEAYAVFSAEFVAGSGQAINGFNTQQLQADLRQL